MPLSSVDAFASPRSGPFVGGTVVTINLKGLFDDEARNLECKFGENRVRATNMRREEYSLIIECESPSNSKAASVNLSILRNEAPLSLVSELTFTYNSVLQLKSVSPNVGGLLGGTLLHVMGKNFVQGSKTFVCRFGVSQIVPAVVKNDTELVCISPTSPTKGVVTLSVSANSGSDFSAMSVQYYYADAPSISSVVPDRVSAFGGAVITVKGSNFVRSNDLSCRFGSTIVRALWYSATILSCEAPSHEVGFARFEVSNNAVEFYGHASVIEYVVPHTITSIMPSRAASLGGLEILVTGTGFTSVDYDAFFMCRFVREDNSGFVSSNAVIQNNHTMSCVVPPQRKSVVYLEVSLNGGTEFSLGVPLQIYEAPQISSVKPKYAFAEFDTSIYVRGSNFVDSDELMCRFGLSEKGKVPAIFVDQNTIICVLTSTFIANLSNEITLPEKIGLSVSNYNDEFVDSNMNIQISETINLKIVRPSRVTELGGTMMHLRSMQQQDNALHYPIYKCRFQSIRQVLTSAVKRPTSFETHAFECEIPALEPGIASVELWGYHDSEEEDGWLINKVAFEVETAQTLLDMRLSTTSQHETFIESLVTYKTGGTRLLLSTSASLEEIHASNGLYCVFDNVVVPASQCESSVVQCVSPPQDRIGQVEVKLRVYSDLNESEDEKAYYDLVGNPNPLMIQYVETPIILEVTPKTIPLSAGVILTVRGKNFVNSPLLRARVDNIIETSRVKFVSDSELLVDLREPHPDRHSIINFKLVSVIISINSVDFSAESVLISMERDLEIQSVQPSRCPTSGGHNVLVTGGPFAMKVPSDNIRCRFGSDMTSIGYRLSNSQIECKCPVSPNGVDMVNLRVSMDAGETYTMSSVRFDYVAPAQVTSLLPSIGPQTGGTVITVLGTNFRNEDKLDCVFASESIKARIGSRHTDSRVSATVLNSTHLTCIVPAIPNPRDFGLPSSGLVSVSLSTRDFARGQRQTGQSFTHHTVEEETVFLYHDTVEVTSVTPIRGNIEGGTVVHVHGKNFVNSALLSCRFGKHGVSHADFLDSEHLLCHTPSLSTSWSSSSSVFVQVSNNGLDFSHGGPQFSFVPKLEMFNVVPSKGSIGGGTEIRIVGKGFDYATDLQCKFGNQMVQAMRIMQNVISCTLPQREQAETVRLSITSNNQDFEASLDFDYVTSPIIYEISPSKGPSGGGTKIMLRGGNFINSNVNMLCDFDGDVSTPAQIVSDSFVTCTTPNHASGLSKVSLVSNDAMHTNIFSELVHSFLFYQSEIIYDISPSKGPSHGGTVVIVSGQNFRSDQSLSCRFGAIVVPATSISTTRLRCVSPSSLDDDDTVVGFSVSNNGADFPSGQSTQFYYYADEFIGMVFPSRGSRMGGTLVTIQGENFEDSEELACRFGDDIITPATFRTSKQIECETPLLNNANREIQRISIISNDVYREVQSVQIASSSSLGPEVQTIRTVADSSSETTHRVVIRQRPNIPETQRIRVDFTPLRDAFSVTVVNTTHFSLTLQYFNRFDRLGANWTAQSTLSSSYIKEITVSGLSTAMSDVDLETNLAAKFTSYELGGEADYSPVVSVQVLNRESTASESIRFTLLIEQDFTGSTTQYSAGPLGLYSDQDIDKVKVNVLQVGSYCEVQRVWIPENGAGMSWYLIRDGSRTSNMSMTASAENVRQELELLEGVLSVRVSRELRAPESLGEPSRYVWIVTFAEVSDSYDGLLQIVTNLGIGEDEATIEQEMNTLPIQRGVERAVKRNFEGVRGTFRVRLGEEFETLNISVQNTNANEMERLIHDMFEEHDKGDIRVDVAASSLGTFGSRYWDITLTHHTGPIELLNVSFSDLLPFGTVTENGTTISVSRLQSVDTTCCASIPNGFQLSFTNEDNEVIESETTIYLNTTEEEFSTIVSSMFDNEDDEVVEAIRTELINQGVEWTFSTSKPITFQVNALSSLALSRTSIISEIIEVDARSEIQRVEIVAVDSNSRIQDGGGGFVLSMGHEQTNLIAYNASTEEFKASILEHLSWGIGDDVSVSKSTTRNADNGIVWYVTFTSCVGDVPSLSGETIGISASPRPETEILVSEFRRGTGQKVSGSFVLCHAFRCTNAIEANVSALDLKTILETDLSSVGHVNVSREVMKGGNGEYEWHITFTDSTGDVSEMLWGQDVDYYYSSNMLSGTNARVVVTESHKGSLLGGNFNLMYGGLRSVDIPFDATAREFRDVLVHDMSTIEFSNEIIVTRSESGRESSGGFTWMITFSSKLGDVELIKVDTSNLVGTDVFAVVQEVESGVDQLGGNFTLSFKEHTTSRINVHSDASEILKRLEMLQSIGRHGVKISQVEITNKTEIAWDVTFVSRGSESLLNEQPLFVADDRLITGSGSHMIVRRIQSSCCDVFVANNGVDFITSSKMMFAFEEEVEAMNIDPSSGASIGGTVVRIQSNTPFVPNVSTFCVFQQDSSQEVEASVDQDGIATCRTPPGSKGESRVDVKQFSSSTDSAYVTSVYATFVYYKTAKVSNLIPEFGPSRGATNIRVRGENFVNTSSLFCRFSFFDVNIDVVASDVLSDEEIICSAPAFREFRPTLYDETSSVYHTSAFDEDNDFYTTRLRVSNNGVDFSTSSMAYRYVPDVVVHSVSPSKSVVQGGTLVTVSGQNFVKNDALSCGFGSDHVKARWISHESIICETPPREFQRSSRIVQVRHDIPNSEIQKISILASVHSTGNFVISYNSQYVEVRHNTSAEEMQDSLSQLASVGDGVRVSRDVLDVTGNHYWYVTFLEEETSLLRVEETNMTENASIYIERVLQYDKYNNKNNNDERVKAEIQHITLNTPSPEIYRIDVDTTDPLVSEVQRFTIEMNGIMFGMFAIVTPLGDVSTPLLTTCTKDEFLSALQDMYYTGKINSQVKSVEIESTDCLISCTRSWIATFKEGDGDIAQLSLLDISLQSSAGDVTLSSSTVQHGTKKMNGFLSLRLGDEDINDVKARFHVRSGAHAVYNAFQSQFPDAGLFDVQVNQSDTSHQSWFLHFSKQDLGTRELRLNSSELYGDNVMAQISMIREGDIFHNKTFSLCLEDLFLCTHEILFNATAHSMSNAMSVISESIHIDKENETSYVVTFPKWKGNISTLTFSSGDDLSAEIKTLQHGTYVPLSGFWQLSSEDDNDTSIRLRTNASEQDVALGVEAVLNLDANSVNVRREMVSNGFTFEISFPSWKSYDHLSVSGIELEGTNAFVEIETSIVEGPTLNLIVLNNGFDSSTTFAQFEYHNRFSVSVANPVIGSVIGGTLVEVHLTPNQGDESEDMTFTLDASRDEVKCRFGLSISDAIISSNRSVYCVTNPHRSGTVDVFVSLNGQDFVNDGSVVFTFQPVVKILSLSPSEGPKTGGTDVVVNGLGFPQDFLQSSRVQCKFDDIVVDAALSDSNEGDFVITCTSPSVSDSGNVKVEVTNNAHDFTSQSMFFRYHDPLFVTQVEPSVGPASGGSEVIIRGGVYTNSSDLQCRFGDSIVDAMWIDDNMVRCLTPSARPLHEVQTISLRSRAERQSIVMDFFGSTYVESDGYWTLGNEMGVECSSIYLSANASVSDIVDAVSCLNDAMLTQNPNSTTTLYGIPFVTKHEEESKIVWTIDFVQRRGFGELPRLTIASESIDFTVNGESVINLAIVKLISGTRNEIQVIQTSSNFSSTVSSGSFRLASQNFVTPSIAFNASASEMVQALSSLYEDIGTVHVERSDIDFDRNMFEWVVHYTSLRGNVERLTVHENLLGGSTDVLVLEYEGTSSPFEERFSLGFEGLGTECLWFELCRTDLSTIGFNTSASELESLLIEFPSISEVDVKRMIRTDNGGEVTWTISFIPSTFLLEEDVRHGVSDIPLIELLEHSSLDYLFVANSTILLNQVYCEGDAVHSYDIVTGGVQECKDICDRCTSCLAFVHQSSNQECVFKGASSYASSIASEEVYLKYADSGNELVVDRDQSGMFLTFGPVCPFFFFFFFFAKT